MRKVVCLKGLFARKFCAAFLSGFSLVEMLMALLVASLLLAALAPVITKRYSDAVNVAGAGGTIKPPAGSYCWSVNSGGSDDIETDANGNRVVKYTTQQGVFYVNFALASGGGGGGGASEFKSEDRSLTGANGTSLKIEKNMGDFDIVSLIGGGGGGGGGAAVDKSVTCSGTANEGKCTCMGMAYDSVSKVCVSRNLGNNARANAVTACSNLSPARKWAVPTTTQLSNWSTGGLYTTLGIVSGDTVWSQTTGTGTCASNATRYQCYYNGTLRKDYTSSSACCSGSSYGQNTTTYSCYCNGSRRTGYTSSSACCSGCTSGGGVPTSPTTHNDSQWGPYCYSSQTSNCPPGWALTDSTTIWACGGTCNGKNVQSCGGTNLNKCYRCGTDCTSPVSCSSTVTSSGSTTTCASTATSYSTCVSYNTNYYYYQLSGASWTSGYATAATGSRKTHCVYSDTGDVIGEAFYSLSGGGGGGAGAIQNNNFDTNVLARFRKAVADNVGGYIVLQVGNGGEGGQKASAKSQRAGNGNPGGESCILITDSTKSNVKYKICAPGGLGGGAADGAKTNAESTGWGAAGSALSLSNACYEQAGAGEKYYFDCSASGKAGGAGGASTSNPTAGGKGAASVLNSVQVGGTAVVNGISASSTNYGAGGGGGSATKTGVGASGTHTFGDGGSGAVGQIYLNYKVKYDAGAGGGGGAGSFVVIREYLAGSESECTFTIGKGGGGGGIAADGKKGGDTSVRCAGGGGETFKVAGGEGGKKGTTATTLGGLSQGGAGGNHGEYSASITSLKPSVLVTKPGYDGTAGGVNDDTYTNYTAGEYSAGGRGGSAREGAYKGGCGALLNDVVCSWAETVTPNSDALNGASIAPSSLLFPDFEVAEHYGASGMGGGGGAWHMQTGSGQGGDGLGGFACIWWEKLE